MRTRTVPALLLSTLLAGCGGERKGPDTAAAPRPGQIRTGNGKQPIPGKATHDVDPASDTGADQRCIGSERCGNAITDQKVNSSREDVDHVR